MAGDGQDLTTEPLAMDRNVSLNLCPWHAKKLSGTWFESQGMCHSEVVVMATPIAQPIAKGPLGLSWVWAELCELCVLFLPHAHPADEQHVMCSDCEAGMPPVLPLSTPEAGTKSFLKMFRTEGTYFEILTDITLHRRQQWEENYSSLLQFLNLFPFAIKDCSIYLLASW